MKYIQLNLETQNKSIISIGDTTNLCGEWSVDQTFT